MARVMRICHVLPEARYEIHARHATFLVRQTVFAYYLNDHHGDGIIGVVGKVLPGDNAALIAAHPAKYYMPAYVGPRGWVGLRLDVAGVDWNEVAELLVGSYKLVAPNRLALLAKVEWRLPPPRRPGRGVRRRHGRARLPLRQSARRHRRTRAPPKPPRPGTAASSRPSAQTQQRSTSARAHCAAGTAPPAPLARPRSASHQAPPAHRQGASSCWPRRSARSLRAGAVPRRALPARSECRAVAAISDTRSTTAKSEGW